MIRALVFGAALVAGPALAQDFTADQQAVFLAAFAESGCSMSVAEAQDTLPVLGIEYEVANDIAGKFLDAGQATLSDDLMTLTLSAEVCK
jgi:hypothetical protein